MKKLLFILLSIVSINLIANNSPFVTERVTTDFNSVIYSYGKILCFGDYGIITHSSDEGTTWQQSKLNEKYNIYNVIQVNNNLVGLTQNAIIKSSDNGATWEIKELADTLLAIASLEKGTIAILTKDKITEYDLNLNEISNFPINPTNLAIEMTSLGNSVYLPIQDFKLLKYDFEKRESETVNLKTSINCSNCMKANSIKMNNNKLYLIANNDLYESSDLGANWQSISKGISTNYLIDFGNVFELSCVKSDKPLSKSTSFSNGKVDLYKLKFESIDKSGIRIPINFDTVISKIAASFSINHLFKNNSNILAVGNNNLIITSNDNGKNWTFQSIYNTINGEIHLRKNNVIYNSSHLNTIFTSKNNGVTWRPSIYQDTVKDYYANYKYNFNDNGEGYCMFNIDNPSVDKSIMRTNNYAQSFQADFFSNNDQAKTLVSNKYYFDKYLLLSNINFKGEQQTTLVTHIDSNLALDTVIKIDSILFCDIYEAEDKTLYAYGFYQSNYFADSLGNKDYQIKKNKLFKSLDRGLSWHEVNVAIPFSTTNPVGKILDNKIITSVSSIIYKPNYWNHAVYDISTNTFDSINYPVNIQPKNIPIKFNDYYLFVATNGNYLYYTKDLYVKDVQWDSVKLEVLFPQWKNYYYDDPNYLGDNALRIIGGNDNELILNIQKSEFYTDGTYTGKQYFNGIAKLKLKNSSSVIEDDRISLYSYNPYPIPAVNSVKSLIYWNSSYNIEEAEIGIYDIFGAKLNNINYSIQKLEPFSGNLIVDCTNIPSGVYFARVALGGENLNIPIVVSK